MFIANAVYRSQGHDPLTIAICIDKASEKLQPDQNGIIRVHYEKPIVDAVFRTAARSVPPVDFRFQDEWYTLLRYTAGHDERLYNKYRENHVVRKVRIERDREICVCSERCRCTACFDEYGFGKLENICGKIELCNEPGRVVEVDIQRCARCSKYFIDKESLDCYERRYGPLRFIKRNITGNESSIWKRSSVTYKEDTILSRNGYSTSLYTSQRQEILVSLMKRGTSKAELKDILSRFISQRSVRCPGAASAWKADLEFVNSFGLDQEEAVRFL